MRRTAPKLLARLAGAAAASGLALAGLVVAASPASAAACSGTSGVTVVVDTGGSISTRCASGNPNSAWAALEAAGYGVDPVSSQPGAICKISNLPATTCTKMPPASEYWAFFYAKRGGSWTYSSTGARSYDPASGSVIGFRLGSGQQPGIAPPAPPKTSAPAPTKPKPKPAPTPKPKPTASKPKPTTPAATSGPSSTAPNGSGSASAGGKGQTPSSPPSATPNASASAGATPSASANSTATAAPSPSETASDLAVAPTSLDADDGGGPGTLLAGGALVALVAGGAGWAAWKRRV